MKPSRYRTQRTSMWLGSPNTWPFGLISPVEPTRAPPFSCLCLSFLSPEIGSLRIGTRGPYLFLKLYSEREEHELIIVLLPSKSTKIMGQGSLIILYPHRRSLFFSLQGAKNLEHRQDSEVSLNIELPKGWEHRDCFGLKVRISCQDEASLRIKD